MMVITIFLFQSLLITFLHAFDGPQPDDIVLGAYPNQNQSHSQPMPKNNDKIENPVKVDSLQSKKPNSFLEKMFAPLEKPILEQILAGSGSLENGQNFPNVEPKTESAKHPNLPGYHSTESFQEVKSPTSNLSLSVLEDKKNDYLLDLYNHSTNTQNQTLTSLQYNISLEISSNKTDIKENKTHVPLYSVSNVERLNITDAVLLEHEKKDSNTMTSHSCQYGNFCSGFLILASSVYFHHTLNIAV